MLFPPAPDPGFIGQIWFGDERRLGRGPGPVLSGPGPNFTRDVTVPDSRRATGGM